MPKYYPCKRYNARVSIDYNKPITRTVYGKREEYLASKIIVEMVRTPSNGWSVTQVKASAAKKSDRQENSYRKAYYFVDDFDRTQEIDWLVDAARRLVYDNSRDR